MFRHVPNALTALRLVLAALFFGILSYYQYDVSGRHGERLWLNIAFTIYLIALFTDFLDGYLARRWKVEGVFGRIVDPFVDKVLVLGSFIFFAGKNFTIPQLNPGATPANVMTITGVVPWMVVVILGRELLVTSLRGSSESSGVNFAAAFSGKLKMTLQSITILVILVYVNYRPMILSHHLDDIASPVRDGFIWLTIAVTVASGISYVRRGIALYQGVKGGALMRRWIVTLLGAGLMPKAPGTWGSLVTCIILYPILAALGPNATAWLICLLTGLFFFSALCVALGPFGIQHFQREDPGPFVLDEGAGICLTLLFLPPQSGWRLVALLGLGFAAFRLFDVTKPPPARQLENLPRGWGILLDDLAAAVYANLVCQFIVRLA